MDKVNKNESSTFALVSRLDERTAAFAESLKNLAEENRRIGDSLLNQMKEHIKDDDAHFEKHDGKFEKHDVKFDVLFRWMWMCLGGVALVTAIIAVLTLWK